jgi:hypothetical protein
LNLLKAESELGKYELEAQEKILKEKFVKLQKLRKGRIVE